MGNSWLQNLDTIKMGVRIFAGRERHALIKHRRAVSIKKAIEGRRKTNCVTRFDEGRISS